ncbi:hypothetical protein B0H11DRAFT_2198099 [Mycena galericulata]|nr:hypothetical protein B0H11DRAFT_2198099 [Mycena galericulata]
MLSVLPTEILEHIIDMSKDNRRTLGACGATGRQLLPRSRKHLFAKVMFGSPRADITRQNNSTHPAVLTRCDLFFDLLEQNPTLAQHVTELALSEGGHPNLTAFWISQSTTLVPVVQHLSNIRTFTLRYGQGAEWSTVLVQAMCGCIHRPSIEVVEIAALHVGDVDSFFAILNGGHSGRKLKYLRLSNLIFPPNIDSAERVSIPKHENALEVDTLNVAFQIEWDSEGSLLDLLSNPRPLLNMSRLRHLRLTAGDGLSRINQWLRMSATSIEQLDLKFIGDYTPWLAHAFPPNHSQHFPPTPQLQVIRFEISVAGAIPALSAILSQLKAPSLTAIVVYFLSAYDRTADDSDEGWATLESVISRQSFPSLTAVRFESGRPYPPEWQLRLRQRLPILDGSGLLIMASIS